MPNLQKSAFKNFFTRSLLKSITQQSLTVKLVLTMSLLVFMIVAVGSFALMTMTRQVIAETSVANALYYVQLLKTQFLETMLSNEPRHEELESLIRSPKLYEHVDEVNVFNAGGKISYSSREKNLGRTVDQSVGPTDRVTSDAAIISMDSRGAGERLRILHHIHGGPLCMKCHTVAENGVLGGIELFVPLAPIYKRFFSNRAWLLLLAVLITLSGAFLIRWLVLTIVKRPIKKLITVMEKAEKGILDVRTKIREDPDLSRLAESFNAMVSGIHETQKKIEEQYRKELSQSNRLSSLGQLISNVSHEIKNPLAAMSSALHAIRRDLHCEPGQEEIFEELTLQIDRIQRTVNNLLRYARQAPPKFERFALREAVHQAFPLAAHRLQNNSIQVQEEFLSENEFVVGDLGQLQQVFLNLILNASAAMPEGGTLTIRVDDYAGQKHREIFRDPGVPGLIAEVRDSGEGIPPEDLEKIFQPFFTTRVNGTGLGLSVVKGIVEAHHGLIHIESQPGVGTSVFLFLPLSEVGEDALGATRSLFGVA